MKLNKGRYLEELEYLVSNNGIANNPSGLKLNMEFIVMKLEYFGFNVRLIAADTNAPIVYAVLRNPRGASKVGLYSHYDVEYTNETEWRFPSSKLTIVEDRVFGRGVADNLGILLLRLHAFEQLNVEQLPEIHWIFQGQEEIAAPLAHKEFPKINLPIMNVWFEETGYFDIGTQRQRFLTLNENPELTYAKEVASKFLNDLEFTSYTEHRTLTKFDECPFVTHILGDQPYIAIGPNDEYSKIHEPNESLSLPLIDIAFQQFIGILKYYGT